MTTLEKLEELIYVGFKETDRKIKESSLETERKFQETQRELKETFRKTDREIRNVSLKVKNITDTLGIFAENMVAPAIVKLFNKKGIPITDYFHRLRSSKWRIEYDIVAFSDGYIVVVSVNSKLRVEDVREFLNERLPIFKEVFPRYKDMKVIGAVAGASIVQESDIYAIKRGLYVLAQSGDNITVLNDKNFEPKIF